MSPKQWVFDPDSGGVKIKESIKRRTEERIIRYAESNFRAPDLNWKNFSGGPDI